MAPSSTIGAIIPVSRSAPVKVVVFQCPWGMPARQRSPRLERPRSRAIFVDRPVSSMKTSLAGSKSSWLSNQAWHFLKTSGRSCSNACAVFLYVKPHLRSQLFSARRPIRTSRSSARRATISLSVMSSSVSIRVSLNQAHDEAFMPIEARPASTTGRSRLHLTGFGSRYPADRGRWRHTEPRRSTTRRQARLRCLQNTNPQIATQCSSHPRPPCLETFNQTCIIPSHHNRFSDWWICSRAEFVQL